MIWTLFEALSEPHKWAITIRNGEMYLAEVETLPRNARIIGRQSR